MLGESASRALGVVTIDFCFIKLGCYFLNVQGSSQVVDLVAYGGYKFVGCVFYASTSLFYRRHLQGCLGPNGRIFGTSIRIVVSGLPLCLPSKCFLSGTST